MELTSTVTVTIKKGDRVRKTSNSAEYIYQSYDKEKNKVELIRFDAFHKEYSIRGTKKWFVENFLKVDENG